MVSMAVEHRYVKSFIYYKCKMTKNPQNIQTRSHVPTLLNPFFSHNACSQANSRLNKIRLLRHSNIVFQGFCEKFLKNGVHTKTMIRTKELDCETSTKTPENQ